MWSSLLSFLCNGITFAVLRISGNVPVSKQVLTSLESQYEKKSLKVFNKNTGIPLGPVDFEISNLSIILTTSAGTVGHRKKDEPSGLMHGTLNMEHGK